MTEAFRQKLLNWFISMLLLLLTTATSLLVFWFFRAPEIEETQYSSAEAIIAGMSGYALVVFFLLFPPILIWHLLDFADRTEICRSGHFSRFFASHSVLIVPMGIAQVASIIIATGVADWNSCDDLPAVALPYSCAIGIEWWAELIFFGPLLFSLVLCIGKAAITIRSRFGSAS